MIYRWESFALKGYYMNDGSIEQDETWRGLGGDREKRPVAQCCAMPITKGRPNVKAQ